MVMMMGVGRMWVWVTMMILFLRGGLHTLGRLVRFPRLPDEPATQPRQGREVDGVTARDIGRVPLRLLPVADLELGPVLVEGHGVSEVADRVRGLLAEGQLAREKAHARDAVEEA